MKDKELTKERLIIAVGEIIRSKGLNSVRISKVARQAEVDRKLIYRYFGNLDNLIEAYIIENDYWMLLAEEFKLLSNDMNDNNAPVVITKILQELLKYFAKESKMQNLILMELNGSFNVLRSIHNVRESIGQILLEKTDAHFENSTVNFRAVAALLVGGIYYTILHTVRNGHQFADVNMDSDEGMMSIHDTLEKVVNWAFDAANQKL